MVVNTDTTKNTTSILVFCVVFLVVSVLITILVFCVVFLCFVCIRHVF
jgi:hypothetical protein